MAGLTDTTLDQPPRLDLDPSRESVETLASHVDEILKYLERLRRRLGRLVPHYQTGTATFNPSNLADGAGETTTVTVTGASLGDVALASFSLDTQGITVTAWVSAANTVSVRLQNETGGALDLASGTLSAWTFTPPTVA